jgi:hypothetical protein
MTVKSITPITDHADVAISRLPQQYKDASAKYPAFWQAEPASGWEGLLQSFISPAQGFETIANQMLNERSLTTSEGVNLDRIGQIVGQDRQGLDDASYLGTIGAQIAENNSDGTANELLAIAEALLADDFISVEIKEMFPAKAVIDIGVTDPLLVPNNNSAVVSAMEGAKLAGVDIDVEIYVADNFFAFDSDTSSGSAGFATTDNPEDGGNYTTIIN